MQATKEIKINHFVRECFSGLKQRNKLIGKEVKFIGKQDYTDQLIQDEIYTIKELSIGNHYGVVYLSELPNKRKSMIYTNTLVPNCYDVRNFTFLE